MRHKMLRKKVYVNMKKNEESFVPSVVFLGNRSVENVQKKNFHLLPNCVGVGIYD